LPGEQSPDVAQFCLQTPSTQAYRSQDFRSAARLENGVLVQARSCVSHLPLVVLHCAPLGATVSVGKGGRTAGPLTRRGIHRRNRDRRRTLSGKRR
jgi:hypothetical protein